MLIDLLREDKIELTKRGERWVAHCPFHDMDQTPSFTIYEQENYFCFGCNVWGDSLTWLIEYRKMEPNKALELLGVNYQPRKPKTVIKIKNTYKTYPFLAEVAEKYHQYLLKTPGAVTYLKSRGLTNETIRRYKLGYTDGRVLNLRFAEEHELAQSVGLIADNGYELMSHRIVIPNLVQNNLCDFMIGRTVTHDKVKYLGLRAPKPLYGFYDFRSSLIIFVVEGHFDYLILRQWEYPVVVIGGTHIREINLSMLRGHKIVVVPDNDVPGRVAATRLVEKLENASILDYASLGVKDVSELAEQPDGKDKFDKIVREQLPWTIPTSNKTYSLSLANLAPTILSPSI